MASLYSYLPGIQPTQQEIVQGQLLATQILQAQFPDLDLRAGTALADLVVQPTAFLMALLNKGLNFYFAQNSLSTVTDDTSEDIVDALLSNWFLTRSLGTFAVISARLYFARQKNVSISSNVFFSPDNSLLFYPQQTTTIPAAAMSFDSSLNEWYIDINLQASQEGTNYNLSSGSLLYFANFDNFFLHAEINFLVSASIAGETNTQFITRAETAISTRNLINVPSIVSNLQQEFNFLPHIQPIGMGDPEMIRDQIKAVFDPEEPRLLTSLGSTGTLATATLENHGWFTGQTINVTGAIPTGYNGSFAITVLDPNTFTFILSGSFGVVTLLPTVQSDTAPVLIHNGGMIDIYCDNSLANSVVQLTTDSTGLAQLTGPVYSFTRSSISGGGSADTIPLQGVVNYSSITVDAADQTIHVSATAHGLTTGTEVELSGLVQTLIISAISCSGLTVTATVTGHGLATDDFVVVADVTPADYNGEYAITVVDANTITFTVPTTISSSGSGSPMVLNNPRVNSPGPITVTGADSFDINTLFLWTAATTTGTLVINYDIAYTVTNTNLRVQDITSLICVGTEVTVTLEKHGQTVNRYVTISGATPSGYNGQWLIDAVLNDNQFTFQVATTLSSPATGDAVCTSVVPWFDLGFSTRQVVNINFGSAFPNGTASFDINYFSSLSSVQPYLEDAANRVLAADPLARGFNFYILDISVTGYGTVAPSSGVVQATAQTFLTALQPGQVFLMSDFVAALENAGITAIQTPPLVKYTKYTRDLITPVEDTILDYLDPNDRTSVFLLGVISTTSAPIVPTPASV